MNLKSTSKFLSLILRHKPEAAGITLDDHGWADVEELIVGVRKSRPFDRQTLKQIVATDEKQRYSFNKDHTLIRANQGHSIPVDVELIVTEPPEILYHGTGEQFAASIEEKGLLPMRRLYVHLSGDIETARKVGFRHSRPVIFRVVSGQMARDGILFYRSVNGVWLTKAIPSHFLELDS